MTIAPTPPQTSDRTEAPVAIRVEASAAEAAAAAARSPSNEVRITVKDLNIYYGEKARRPRRDARHPAPTP